MSELLESFTVGGLTALAMGGSAKAIDVAKYGVDGSKANSIINQINELNAEEYNLERNNKLNSDLSAQYAEKRLKLVNELGNQLSQMDTDSKKYTKLTVDNNIDAISNFNAKKQVVYEAVDSMNKKYGADLKIEFKNNETISKENSGLKIDGYIDNKTNTIVINEQSVDPYSVILAHEITHSTENNALYKEISNDILSSMSKEQLDASYENLKKLYGKATSTEQLNKEIVANYMGKALGSNSKTILNTFAKKPNVVSKVINWLDSKLSKNSVNNAEKQELNNIRNKMQNLLQSERLESNTNFALEYSARKYVSRVSVPTYHKNIIEDNLKKAFIETDARILNDYTIIAGKTVYIVDANNSLEYGIYDGLEFDNKHLAELGKKEIDNYVKKVGRYRKQGEDNLFKTWGEESSWGSVRSKYNDIQINRNGVQNTNGESSNNSKRIYENDAEINERRYSINPTQQEKTIQEANDSQGNKLSKQQQEYFKNSKIRDYSGNLFVMYHGTSNNDFNVFDRAKSSKQTHINNLGVGHYFTSSQTEANKYVGEHGRIIEAYLNIQNPYVITNNARIFTKETLGKIAEESNVSLQKLINEGGKNVVNEYLKKLGYDGIVWNSGVGETITAVAFDSNQIKKVTNDSPTSNNDIRYSLSPTQQEKTVDEVIDETKKKVQTRITRINKNDSIVKQ